MLFFYVLDCLSAHVRFAQSTSGVLDHMRTKHGAKFKEFRDAQDKQLGRDRIQTSMPNALVLSEKQKEKIDRILVEMIAEDIQPFRVVERPVRLPIGFWLDSDVQGFRRYSAALNPSYTPPTAKTIKGKAMVTAQDVAAEVRFVLRCLSHSETGQAVRC